LTHLELLGPGLDPLLFVLHALSVVVYVGAAVALVTAAYAVWAARRPWPARTWTTTLAVSALVMLWTACVCHLMAFRTTY
jgi:NADH:ubiquinone oxidoreductase subunit 6 (subunit J)